jgi:hypothetical protein
MLVPFKDTAFGLGTRRLTVSGHQLRGGATNKRTRSADAKHFDLL